MGISLFLFHEFRQNNQMFKSTLEGWTNNWHNIFSLFKVTIKVSKNFSLLFNFSICP